MSQTTIAAKIIKFNKGLQFKADLPANFNVLNPFIENPETIKVMKEFYNKFYNDNKQRKFILGINPGRNGAGVTGVPFTDTKRLQTECGITMHSAYTHEISSVFIYEMINAFGGVQKFYSRYYINSPFPLAIVRNGSNKEWLNANYYDDIALFKKVKPFMIATLQQQIKLGLNTNEVFVLGKKNATFIKEINKEAGLFNKLTVLEHPRYIQQYKSKDRQLYIDKYLSALS